VLATGTPEPLPASSASAVAGDGAVLESSLTEDFRGLPGNLPPITQILLQERFSPRPDLAYGYYADDKTAMFGSGTKVAGGARQRRSAGRDLLSSHGHRTDAPRLAKPVTAKSGDAILGCLPRTTGTGPYSPRSTPSPTTGG